MTTATLEKSGDKVKVTAPPGRGTCRFCGSELTRTFCDLGMSPLCESFVDSAHADAMEAFYPLHAYVCGKCFLVQLGEYVTPDHIFSDYAYFSSYSDSWVAHARRYAEQMIEKRGINKSSQVIEIASNDGYLLQWFVQKGVRVLGIEPAANVALVAKDKGVPSVVKFFGQQTAREVAKEHGQADLLLGNNVLAHVPDLNDFVAGMKILLKPGGFITMEFPHLMRLMNENQFDTIYHEHFSYFSLLTVEQVFKHHGLVLFDVEELRSHGGSLRIYVRHVEDNSRPVTKQVDELRAREMAGGFDKLETYSAFEEQVKETKRKLLTFLIEARREGKTVVGYGAPGKGNTLLNYCGIRTDFLDYTVDRSPHKHGKLLPGTRIPIYPPSHISETRPDYVLILPWNLKEEIMKQNAHIREWGGRWVVPIPEVTVFE